jgi:hypothetical protein
MTLRARDIVDICDELVVERVSVTVKEGWDHNPQFFLTFGPLAYRQTIVIEPSWDVGRVKAKLEAARVSPLVEAPAPAPEAKSPPAATHRAKRKRISNVDG